MKNSKIAIGFFAILFALIFGFVNCSFAEQPEKKKRQDFIIYKVKHDASEAQKQKLKDILANYKAVWHKKIKGDINLDKILKKDSKTEEEICEEIIASGAVEFAEPDYLMPPVQIPNDPKYPSQWQHPKINSPGAWDIVTGNPSVIAAVCDTGIESTHPDLAANLLLPGYNAVDGTSNTEPVMSHGTFVAGCIGAVGNNLTGVAGGAWNIRIFPVRITNRTDGWAYTSDMAEGINWAADQGAKVINLSYGGAGSSTIDSAAKYARNKGGLLFMSAGNDGASVTYPDFASFVCVGATNSSDIRASWSNYGAAIDITAPGESVYSTTTGGGYRSGSGTSFSSPIAAGVGALIYSINPSFTPSEVESFIFTTCKDIGDSGNDNVYGYGRIDAAAAVLAAKNYTGNTAPYADAVVTPTQGNVPLTVNFNGSNSYDNDGTISSYQWNFGDGVTASGEIVSHTYTKTGTFNATLTVTDNQGGTDSEIVQISVAPDPTTILAPSGLTAKVLGGAVRLNWSDNSANEEGFYIERGVKVSKVITYQRVGQVNANVSSYEEALTTRGTYYYRVNAFNNTTGKVSSYSNIVQARVR